MDLITIHPDRPLTNKMALAKVSATAYSRAATSNAFSVGMTETIALTLALLAASYVRAGVTGEAPQLAGPEWAILPIYWIGAQLTELHPGWGLGAVEELRRQVVVVLLTFGLTMVGMWLAQQGDDLLFSTSRLTLGGAGLISLVAVPWCRSVVKRFLISRDLWGVPAVVYGSGQTGAHVVRQLQEERGIGYNPIAVFDDDPERWGEYLDTIPIVGDTSCYALEASVAFMAVPEGSPDERIALLEGPLSCYRTVVVVPDLIDAPSLWVKPRDIAGVLGLEITSALTRTGPRVAKRTFDLVVTVGLAPLWMPIVGLLALAVWLEDRASPFYAQRRVGRARQVFAAHKLRTMVPDAEAVLQRALAADDALRAEWEAFFKLERDPRITRVGAFLRKTSLDELPQLWNVLTGQMSLVGPRPLPLYHHDELAARVRDLRERVRPGITGLWQVSGRSDTGNLGMERWDPYYVRNWSLWLDLVILVRTFRVVLSGSGAY